jgi:hypothetical protein
MKFSNHKIKAFLTISVVVLLTSCEIEDFNIDPLSEGMKNFFFKLKKLSAKTTLKMKSFPSHLNTTTMKISLKPLHFSIMCLIQNQQVRLMKISSV